MVSVCFYPLAKPHNIWSLVLGLKHEQMVFDDIPKYRKADVGKKYFSEYVCWTTADNAVSEFLMI